MSRPIMLSKVFLKGHPREGELTEFRKKMYASLYIRELRNGLIYKIKPVREVNFTPKSHTIRAGHRWKVGDFFSPREWSGTPYRSKQTVLFDDIEIKKVWDVKITADFRIFVGGDEIINHIQDLARNDGLSLHDFMFWFAGSLPFDGQIICWNNDVDYDNPKYYCPF